MNNELYRLSIMDLCSDSSGGSFQSHSSVISGSFQDHSGSFQDHSGVIPGSFWGHSRIIPGHSGIILGSIQAHSIVISGSFQGHSRVILGSIQGLLCRFSASAAPAQKIHAPAQRRLAAPDAPVADSRPFFYLKNHLAKRY